VDNDIPLLNTIDIEILMHREAHYGGSFEVMIAYYERGGVGVMPDFSITRLKELETIENQQNSNLARELIPPAEMEQVEKAQQIYIDLRKVYGSQQPNDISTLISDLILSEEDNPLPEINALVRKGDAVLQPLVDLLHSNTFYLPLYPGYGRSPILAAETLSKLGNIKAIPALFEAMGQENFFTDDAMIIALSKFGDDARTFLLKMLRKKPFNKDNEHAAIALTGMEDHPAVGQTCLEILEKDNPFFSQYLVFGCSGLVNPESRAKFKSLTTSDQYPKYIKDEMAIIIKNWQ
jgi:hypothetical protein